MANYDDSYDPDIVQALALSPLERVKDAENRERVYEEIRRLNGVSRAF